MEKKSFFKGRFFIGFMWFCFTLLLPILTTAIAYAINPTLAQTGLLLGFAIIGLVIAWHGFHEMVGLTIEKVWRDPITYVGLLFTFAWFLVPSALGFDKVAWLIPAFLMTYILLMFFAPVKRSFKVLGAILVSGVVIGIGAGAIFYAANLEFLFYVQILVTVWFFDMFSFFSGVIWTKIIPSKTGIKTSKTNFTEISPNKTLEGLLGGATITVIFMTVLYMVVQPSYMGTLEFVLITIAVEVGSFYGDLFFSNIKRYFGVKDYSNLLYSHGGILDRSDSLLFAVPLAILIHTMFSHIG